MQKSSEDYVRIKWSHVVGGVLLLGFGGYRLYQSFQAHEAGRGAEAVGAPIGSLIALIGLVLAVLGWYLYQIFVLGKKAQLGSRSMTRSLLPETVDLSSRQFDDLDV